MSHASSLQRMRSVFRSMPRILGLQRLLGGTAIRITIVLILASSSLVVGQSRDEKVDYLVLGVSGNWTLVTGNTERGARSNSLRFGDVLTGETCVAGETPSPGATSSLLVWFDNGQVVYRCDRDDAGCQKPSGKSCVRKVVKPQGQNMTDAARRLFRALLTQFSHGDGSWINAVSRSASSRLSDGVVTLRRERIDLGTVLKELPESDYWVQLTPMQPDLPNARLHVEWNTRSATPLVVKNFKPGLYGITLLDKSKEPSDDDAIILVAPTDRYQSLAAEFDEMSDIVRSWPKEVTAGNRRRCLQSYLKMMAETTVQSRTR